jgi:hypothetical protein
MLARGTRLLFATLSIVCLAAPLGCGIDQAETPLIQVPVIGTALERGYQANQGLVTGLDKNGVPARDGAAMDPVVVEARRFYDTLQEPNAVLHEVDYPDPFTGAPPSPRKTAPLTFDAWKQVFQIPPRLPGETLAAYRARANVVIYYNKNELGLGRELGCAEFPDGTAPNGTSLTGVACYVTNYGTAFRDQVNSLPLAVEGLHAKNTVCITYRPSAEPGYEVQFYTYNGEGLRREWAQLDTLGPRPLPQVCMNCHGGSYDETKHLAKFARFLPLDPNVVAFAETGDASRASQEERIRVLNRLSMRSPLTPAQIVMLDQLYGGKIAVAGTKSANEWAPPAWNDSNAHRDLFDKVLKPNCTTCHAAMQTGPAGNVLSIYTLFDSPTLLEAGLPGVLCGNFAMPNSQATLLNFWERGAAPITLAGKTYATGALGLLAAIGTTPDLCSNLEEVANCNRGSNPDELCGNAYSGRACNRVTGECVPNMQLPREPGKANGVCKTDPTLKRGCPWPQVCQASPDKPAAGLEGFDGVCMP